MFLAQGGRARRQGDLSPVLEKQKPATRSACHVVSLLAGTVQIHGEKSPSSEASAAPAILLYQAWALVGPPTSAAPPCTRGLANGQAAPQTPVFLSGQDGGGGRGCCDFRAAAPFSARSQHCGCYQVDATFT